MYTENQVFDRIKKILRSQLFGVIATQGLQYPYCTLVGFTSSDDCKEIIFATVRHSRKYQNIQRNSKVSLLVDNQKNTTADLQDAEALTVLGSSAEIEKSEAEKYLSLYINKHPYLKEFVTAPNCALIKVTVDKFVLVNNFQNVVELKIQ
jgi:nitroimidazol reductase NimA-like FMN-containing flavoprotein (pyridoxamine 5'-phosphate oxidase superfamily)